MNASVGHCMYDLWPPPLVRSQFLKELAVDVVRSRQWGLFVLLSQCKRHRMLSAPNSTKNLQWMWVAGVTAYTTGPEPPMSVLQLKENFNSECQCHRMYDLWLFRCLLYNSGCCHCMYAPWMYDPWLFRVSPLQLKKYFQCRLLSTGCCGTACMTRELCLTVLQ